VADGPGGVVLTPSAAAAAPARDRMRPPEVVSLLDEPASFDASVHWMAERWPNDVARGIRSFERHETCRTVQHVVVETADPGDWPAAAEVVALVDEAGWASARNAALARSLGRIVIVADGSVELTGPVVAALEDALRDRAVGLAGPFGIDTDDLREFHPAPGPDVDALEGYLVAMRRESLVAGLRFDERFRFYRMADVDLSFQVKAMGLRTVVAEVPVVRHEHRGWTSTPEDRRAALSKRNFYRFLERWRGRFDLTVAGRPPDGGGGTEAVG
jgi:cysteinyl-tRNA synthetase